MKIQQYILEKKAANISQLATNESSLNLLGALLSKAWKKGPVKLYNYIYDTGKADDLIKQVTSNLNSQSPSYTLSEAAQNALRAQFQKDITNRNWWKTIIYGLPILGYGGYKYITPPQQKDKVTISINQ